MCSGICGDFILGKTPLINRDTMGIETKTKHLVYLYQSFVSVEKMFTHLK